MPDPNTLRPSGQPPECLPRPLICELLEISDDDDLMREWEVLRLKCDDCI